jgi:Tfp pilus assembly major pilin PilA
MDVKRGEVALTSSKGPTGGVQTANFYSGRFVAMQAAREQGMTEVRLSEQLKCTTNRKKGKVVASAVRSRRLWGSGKGRFRTRGRNSSATVRGTTWLQKDTCSTTTTIVREGTVVVRDFAKRKNVTVKAPKHYVARAR